MRRFAALMLIIVLAFCPAVRASSYLYFQGSVGGDAQEDSGDSIYAWDLEEDVYIPLGIRGGLIEKSGTEPGCYVALRESGNAGQLDLAYCRNGRVERIDTLMFSEELIKVYGYKNGWLYYSTYDPAGDFGICRMDGNGNAESYNTDGFIDTAALEELVFSISEDGVLAFASDIRKGGFEEIFAPVRLCVSLPDGETCVIYEGDRTPCCAWLDRETLIFTDDERRLQLYKLASGEIFPYTDGNGEELKLNLPQTNICLSTNGRYLAYQSLGENGFGKDFGDDGWNPLVVLSLSDGTEITGEDVYLSAGQAFWGKQLQFGE